METVREILDAKGHEVWAVDPRSTVLEAVRLMTERNVGSVLVMDGHRLVGLMSEREAAREIVARERDPRATWVSDIMVKHLLCVRSELRVDSCRQLMTERRVRHLPVIEEGRVIGVISIGDVVKNVIDDQMFLIGQLEDYITGGHGNFELARPRPVPADAIIERG